MKPNFIPNKSGVNISALMDFLATHPKDHKPSEIHMKCIREGALMNLNDLRYWARKPDLVSIAGLAELAGLDFKELQELLARMVNGTSSQPSVIHIRLAPAA